MATTTWTGSQIVPYLYGRIETISNAARATLRNTGSGFHGTITGTDASFTMTAGGANPLSISVDGGAYTTPTLTAGSMPIFAGLTDTAHTVDCRLQAAYLGTGTYYTLASTALSVTGAAPAIALDANYGPQVYAIGANSVFSNLLTDMNTYAMQVGPGIGSSAYYSVPPLSSTGGFSGNVARVRGRADRVMVLTNKNGSWIALEKDGTRIAAVKPTVTTYQWVTLATGLDDGSEHEWTIVCGQGTGGQIIDMIMLGGSNASISATLPTARSTIMCVGDSLTASVDGGGAGTTQGDGTLAYPYVLARLLGKDALAVGRSGTQVLVGSQQIVNDLTQAVRTGTAPTHLGILYGRNNTDTSTTQTDYTSMLNNILSYSQWTGKIVAITVPEIGSYATSGALVNAGIRNAVAAVGSSRVTLVEAAAQTTIGVGTDGTHYNIAGHAQLGTFLYNSGAFADSSSGGGGSGQTILTTVGE